MLGTLTFGAGSSICGVGLLAGGLLCAAGRHAGGNVQVQAWQLLGDSRELQVVPTQVVPGMAWDALQSMAGKAALAGEPSWPPGWLWPAGGGGWRQGGASHGEQGAGTLVCWVRPEEKVLPPACLPGPTPSLTPRPPPPPTHTLSSLQM